ncbi:MAG TPA: methylated-DNA--[protein]-cysteine S-methyltransferase [Solirubrobacteraceae bacterium]|jgi:methylated-DNA-[protein]-cysteine S-methyltransferase
MSTATATLETTAAKNDTTQQMQTLYTRLDSPLGELLLTGDGTRLQGLHMQAGKTRMATKKGWREEPGAFATVAQQLEEYFHGERTSFDGLDLDPKGTPFQVRVWAELRRIPYGETISYGELARRLDQPSAFRAVGLANGRNPIAVIIPCHRVIGANGSLTGFGGGLPNKRLLLELEAARAQPRML